MDLLVILLVAGVTLGLCFLADKGYTKVFRNRKQHHSGLSVRLSQHYGGAGIILCLLGLLSVFRSEGSKVLLFGGILVALLGIGLMVYYLSFGIYYDSETFLVTTFGKKSTAYSYKDIRGQRLYQIAGGNIMVELYLTDGRTVSLQSPMKGMYAFLDAAFAGWCRQTGRAAGDCPFHHPENSCWFPNMED